MRLQTDAIDERGLFDPRYTCDIDNSSPELRWDNPPSGTVGFALLAEDLDAQLPNEDGPFSHWVVYNIPGNVFHLPAGIPPQDALPNGIRQGLNSMGKLGYFGPCPPRTDGSHRYLFRVFALSALPEIQNRATRDILMNTIRGVILETAHIEGRYARSMERAG